jgi:hypothetical protein
MSAGSLSYSGLINYGKITLPSVEGWSTNQSILRDPPKSITTRKIDKVGETSSITEMIDDSGNRNCEAIKVYSRGINPFVSVSYSNEGNNGGQRSGGLIQGGQGQSFLPYRIIKDGAFRPPIVRQEDLLPLSRQPRIWTEAFTQPGFTDFSKKMRNCGTAAETKEVKTNMLNTCARPTAVYRMETPIKEPFEVKYVIQPSIKTSGHSGIRTMDRTTQHVQEPTKEINRNMVYAFAQSNVNENKYVNNNTLDTDPYIQDTNPQYVVTNVNENRYVNNNTLDTEPYIQDTNLHAIATNVGMEHQQIASLEDILDLSDIRTKDLRNIQYQAPISGIEQTKYIHEDINLGRNMPEYSSTTNIGKNIHKTIQHEHMKEFERNIPLTHMSINPGGQGDTQISSRNYQLAPKIQPGGYTIPGNVPMQNRMQEVRQPYESDKSKMSRLVMEQQQGRFR